MLFDFSLLFDFSSSMLQVACAFFYKGAKAPPGYILASDQFLFKCIDTVAVDFTAAILITGTKNALH